MSEPTQAASDALVAMWHQAHIGHTREACDCNDGFGGCGHLGCYECEVDWPCAAVLAALGTDTAEVYWLINVRVFDILAQSEPSELHEGAQATPDSPRPKATP